MRPTSRAPGMRRSLQSWRTRSCVTPRRRAASAVEMVLSCTARSVGQPKGYWQGESDMGPAMTGVACAYTGDWPGMAVRGKPLIPRAKGLGHAPCYPGANLPS